MPSPQAPPPASPTPRQLYTQLPHCLLRDQSRLRNRIRGLERGAKAGRNKPQALDALQRAIAESCSRREQRQRRLPRPEFDDALPVSERRAEIAAAIRDHPVVIVAGATGSGKTTQLPKICLELGRGVAGLIGCTQPRRIAAVTVAGRVAEELHGELGDIVGYKTRFGARHSPNNLVRFMTDGILLAETQGDRRLLTYDTLIIDEAHERSLNIDLLLGYLKQLLTRRPELKVIISSATLDTARFSEFFDQAPVIEVEGRTFPVDIRYKEPPRDQDSADAVADAVAEISSRDRSGDILVFFSGERDIREAADALGKRQLPHSIVLPLFGRLSQAEQTRVFRSSKQQKIVLATNVAETSLTIPGIRYVVDTGLARIHRYSHRSQVAHLQIEPISQASCNQRSGRCGRIGPGICIRLYAEEDYRERPAFTDPEIKRSSLAEVILRMESLGLHKVENFPFIDPPPPKGIAEGYRVLEELGALAADDGLSDLGKQLARLPLDPRLGRMVIAGDAMGCLQEVLTITAGLSLQDPRERPLDKQQAADEKHRLFQDERSDFLSLVKLWQAFSAKQQEKVSRSALRRWCRLHFLSFNRMIEWRDTRRQIEQLAKDMDLAIRNPEPDYAVIHSALLTGLLSRIGQLQDKGHYLGARQLHFHPFPGSVLFRKKAKWIMAGELVDTSRLYGRTLARIDVDWIEPLAKHLVRRSWTDPHWEKKGGRVVAFEQVTLYGLPIVVRRKVSYAPIDRVLSRELFIREGLVRGELRTLGKFLAHNLALMDAIEDLEHRSRRRDILVDEETLYAFYDPLIPDDINDARRFERWRKQTERDDPKHLFMDRDTLMRHQADAIDAEHYPDDIELQGGTLSLDYRFEPAEADDGISINIPLARLAQLDQQEFQWLVPGLRRELFEHLLRGLPKALRRNFVPIPDYAAAAVTAITPGDGPLPTALSHHLLRATGIDVPVSAWALDKLPRHLRMNYRIVDDQGKPVAEGRELEQLQGQLADRARDDFRNLPQGRWQRERVEQWDFGALPEQVTIGRGERAALGFPTLIDHGDHVGLELLHEPGQARREHHAGLRRLFALQLGNHYRQVAKSLPIDGRTSLAYTRFGTLTDLRREVVDGAIERVFLGDPDDDIRDPDAFIDALQRGRPKLRAVAHKLWERVAPLLVLRQQVAAKLEKPPKTAAATNPEAYADMRSQLAWLLPPGFPICLDDARLGHIGRYLKAMANRLDKMRLQAGRDDDWLAQVAPFWREVRLRIGEPGEPIADAEVERLRWLVEEFRVSLFAQELGTAQPASAKRLKQQLDRIHSGSQSDAPVIKTKTEQATKTDKAAKALPKLDEQRLARLQQAFSR